LRREDLTIAAPRALACSISSTTAALFLLSSEAVVHPGVKSGTDDKTTGDIDALLLAPGKGSRCQMP
jgi:hypothetical protein